MIKAVNSHKFLATSQIQSRIFDGNYAIAARRIKACREAGYLKTFYVDRLSEGIHHLAKPAIDICREDGLCAQVWPQTSFSTHLQGLNDVLIALRAEDFQLEWTVEVGKRKFQADCFWRGDIWEYETGSRPASSFGPKIEAWEAFYQSQWSTLIERFPAIYIVSNNVDAVRRVIWDKATIRLDYFIATFDDVLSDAYGAIWQTPGDERRSLCEKADTSGTIEPGSIK